MASIKILDKKLVHNNWLQLEVHKLQYPNGQQLNYHTIKFRDADHGVAIIGITEENKIVLITQYRYPLRKEILELPMGGVSRGETPEDAAKRELQEETGYVAKEVKKIGIKYPFQNISDHYMTYILATGLKKGKSNPEPTENITAIKHMKIDEAIQKVLNGEIQDAISSVGILLYDKMKNEL